MTACFTKETGVMRNYGEPRNVSAAYVLSAILGKLSPYGVPVNTCVAVALVNIFPL